MNNRSNHTPTSEQIAAFGAALRSDYAERALSLPHAVLIVDDEDSDSQYHLFGPFDTRSDAAAVAVDYLETFEEAKGLKARVIPLRPIAPPAPPPPFPSRVSG